jgi:DNA-binding LytR/AlgR family response regulator
MKKNIRTIIIDDEEHWRDNIAARAEMHPKLELIGIFESPMAAYDLITEGVVDLILLDMEMPDANGVEFMRHLSKPPMVIFITAHRDFAIESYEVKAVDYLLKPFSSGRFMQAIEKVMVRMEAENEPILDDTYFFIRENNSFVKIEIAHILFLKSLENYTQIITATRTYTTLMPLSVAIDGLPDAQFLQVHRSFLVNKTKVNVVNKSELFIDAHEIPIGRAYADVVFDGLVKGHLMVKN